MKITKKRLSKKQILATTIIIIAVICLSIFTLDKFGIISIFPQNTTPNIGKEPTVEENKSEKDTGSALLGRYPFSITLMNRSG